jgi:hypothetical protein
MEALRRAKQIAQTLSGQLRKWYFSQGQGIAQTASGQSEFRDLDMQGENVLQ